jgi:hypothetical protein
MPTSQAIASATCRGAHTVAAWLRGPTAAEVSKLRAGLEPGGTHPYHARGDTPRRADGMVASRPMSLSRVASSVGLVSLAARRIRADLSFLLAIWLILSAATTLVAAAFQYSDAVAIGGLRRAVLDAPPSDRGVTVQTSAGPDQVAGFDTAVSAVLTKAFGSVAPVVLAARSTSLAPFGLASDQAARHLTVLGAYGGLDAHARLTSGSWPVAGRSPIEATLSAAAAGALGLAIGDQVALVDAGTPGASNTPLLTVVVTGTWTTDPDDPYWLGDPLDLSGIVDEGSLAYRGPFMVAPATSSSAAC